MIFESRDDVRMIPVVTRGCLGWGLVASVVDCKQDDVLRWIMHIVALLLNMFHYFWNGLPLGNELRLSKQVLF